MANRVDQRKQYNKQHVETTGATEGFVDASQSSKVGNPVGSDAHNLALDLSGIKSSQHFKNNITLHKDPVQTQVTQLGGRNSSYSSSRDFSVDKYLNSLPLKNTQATTATTVIQKPQGQTPKPNTDSSQSGNILMTHLGQSRNKNGNNTVKTDSSSLNPTLPLPTFGNPNQQIQYDTVVETPPPTTTGGRLNQEDQESQNRVTINKLKESNKELAIEREILNASLQKLKEQIGMVSGENLSLAEQRKQDQIALREKDQKIEELARINSGAVRDELNKKDELISSLTAKLQESQKLLTEEQTNHKQALKKLSDELQSVKEEQSRPGQFNQPQNSSQNQDLILQIKKLQEKNSNLNDQSNDLSSELDKLRQDRDKFRQAAEILEGKYEVLEDELEAVIQEKNSMFLTSEELRKRITDLENNRLEMDSYAQTKDATHETQIQQFIQKIEELNSKNQQLAHSQERLHIENNKLEQAINLQSNDMEKMIHEIDRLKPYYRDAQLVQEQMQNYNTLLQETLILRQENQDIRSQMQNMAVSPPDLITVQVSEQG